MDLQDAYLKYAHSLVPTTGYNLILRAIASWILLLLLQINKHEPC